MSKKWHVEQIHCEEDNNELLGSCGPNTYGVCSPETVCDKTTICNLTSLEDANLIAAAPDMLEALKVIISIVKSEEDIIRILDEWQIEHENVIDHIEVVIARAEGGGV